MSNTEAVGRENFVVIPESAQPVSREEGSYRLAYLTAIISMLAADALRDTLGQCRAGKFGEKLRAKAAEPIPYDAFADAIKHLTCMTFYLMSYEQGEESPDWLADFLASCVRAMDQIVEGTPVEHIMAQYSHVSGHEVYLVTPTTLMKQLNFADLSDIAGQPLSEFLITSAVFRSQILNFGLTQTREHIEKRWREMMAQNDMVLE
ncbi:MAG: hypothetical protein K2X77_22310 [Candidatus Obscuribacterales bacterium]|jgi:hypothetical protein|nr:hypothetical protein [Candidatus Obscuribacterales bacterium]